MIKFYDPVYEYNYYFVTKDVLKAQRKIFGEEVTDNSARGWFIKRGNTILIYVENFKKNIEGICTLVHEVNHAVDEVSLNAGIECSEARSYYVSFLIREILTRLKK